MIYTKKYWSENEYKTREGIKYAGYVGIKDGKVYIFDSDEELFPENSYITGINASDFFFDRVLAKELKLPYSKSDIQFGANDFLYTSTIIDSVEKLQANNDYIFRNNIISDTILPAVPECTVFSSEDRSEYYYQYRDSETNELIKIPADKKPINKQITLDNGDTVTIAMMPNYSYNGSGINEFTESVTGYEAYKACYTDGNLNSTYSSIPYLKEEKILNDEKGGVLKRYNFADRGFSGVTKVDPYFYSSLEEKSDYYINKDKNLVIARPYSDKLEDNPDKSVIKYYRNPDFVYDELSYEITSGTIADAESNISSPSVVEKFTLIPAIFKCDKFRYQYKTVDNNTLYAGVGDTFLDVKNKVGFKSLLYNAGTTEQYIPYDYMTAMDVHLNAKVSSANKPLLDNCSGLFEIIREDDVAVYENGSTRLESLAYKIKKVPNPHYISKTFYFSEESMTWKSCYEELMSENYKNNSKFYEYVPVIEEFTHSVQVTNATFNFDKVKNSDICIIDVKNDAEGRKYADSLVFLITETQIAIINFKEYIDIKSANYIGDETFNFRDTVNNSSKVIIIDHVDPTDAASLKFKNLSSIKIYNDELYIVDEGLNMVLHYNIGYLLSDSFDISSIRLADVLQGDGTKNDKVYFNSPHHINADDDYVYVVDRGNKCIKVFSHSLNYVKSLQNGYFSQHDIQAVACNPYSFTLDTGQKLEKNSVWIFSVQSNRFYLSILVDDKVVYYGQIEALKVDNDVYSWNEEIRSICFSKANSNYYYFSTTKRVYKFHCTAPLWPFASLSYFKQHSLNSALVWEQLNYPWNKIPSLYAGISDKSLETKLTWGYERPITSAEVLNNKCFCLCGYEHYDKSESKQFAGDLIFHFGVLYDNAAIADFIKANNTKYHGDLKFDTIPTGDKIKMTKSVALFTYIEPDSFVSAMGDTTFKAYPKYDIISDFGNEYINPLTFNKLMYQVIYNLMQIKEQIFGKFKAAANTDGVVVYDDIIMDDYIDELKLLESSNYYVHNNEVVSITINRLFEDIITLQENIIKMMQTSFMSSLSFVNSSTKLI